MTEPERAGAHDDEAVDVVIVGAGFAGLSAARSLKQAGLSIVVLEARDRVGGRTRNEFFDDGTLLESGGQWGGPTQDHLLSMVDAYNVERYPTPEAGKHVARHEGTVRAFTDDSFALPKVVQVEALLTQKRLERMAGSVALDAPWKAPRAARWDQMTVESWLVLNVRLSRTREFFRMVCTALFSAEAGQLSLLHFLFYCRSGGMLDRLLGTSGGAQEWRLVGGTQGLAERIAADHGASIRLEEPVIAISQMRDGVTVRTSGGSSIKARHCVVAIPQHLIGRIEFDPALPARRCQLVQSVPMGAVIKVHALFESPFWRSSGLSGFGVAPGHTVSLTFDNTPAGSPRGVLVAFVEGAAARRLSAQEPNDRRRAVLEDLSQLFGQAAANPSEYHERDWAAEPWSGGCYGGHFTPGVWSQLGPELRKPFGRVHFAGTETAEEWCGYIDGAISSGRRVADRIISQ